MFNSASGWDFYNIFNRMRCIYNIESVPFMKGFIGIKLYVFEILFSAQCSFLLLER